MSMTFILSCLIFVAAFHGGSSSTITSTITSIVAAPSSTPPSSSYTSDNEFRSSILNSTNFYRKEHNATALTWNTTLTTYASTYADKCQWTHSLGPFGENLAIGYLNATAAVEAWGNERSKYDFGRPTGFSKDTGHFTQLVWKGTKSVGCGRKNCRKGDGGALGWLVVCEYWPPGNVIGGFEAEVQKQVGGKNGGVNGLRGRLSRWLGILAAGFVVFWGSW